MKNVLNGAMIIKSLKSASKLKNAKSEASGRKTTLEAKRQNSQAFVLKRARQCIGINLGRTKKLLTTIWQK